MQVDYMLKQPTLLEMFRFRFIFARSMFVGLFMTSSQYLLCVWNFDHEQSKKILFQEMYFKVSRINIDVLFGSQCIDPIPGYRVTICQWNVAHFYFQFYPIFMSVSKFLQNQVHDNDVIMSTMASQITSLTIVYSTVYSGTDQRKHQSSASPAFVRGIQRWPVNFPHTKGQ